MSGLIGKTALVTGASRGIGRYTAQRLARDGARVGVHYGTNEAAAQGIQGRVGRPDDIGDIIAFLASDDVRWINGQVLDATGGGFLGVSEMAS